MPEVTKTSPFWMSAETGMNGHVDRAVLARAHRDRAQAVAHQHHRHRLVLLGDERDLARERADVGDLADDAAAVDHRHARGCTPCVRPLSTTILRVKGLRAL